ncbi:MAG: tetratricopeptide repeat protein, partial [Phaeodactylibacter sp.]|nr:tetratricopeptide repeat protein [Phaeodactylibacter sp.]
MRTTPPAAVWALSFLLFAFTSSQLQGVNGNSAGTEISTDSLFQKAVQLKTGQKFNSAAELFQTVSQEYKKQQNWEQYIASQRHLAYCFWVTHRGDQALDLCRRTLEEGARWLGPGDIQIAKLYTVMGNVHADRRTKQDFDKCVAYYEKALEIT